MPEGRDFSVFIATFTTASELSVYAKQNRCRTKINYAGVQIIYEQNYKTSNRLHSLGCRSQHSWCTNWHLRDVMPQRLPRFRNPSEWHLCETNGWVSVMARTWQESWENIIFIFLVAPFLASFRVQLNWECSTISTVTFQNDITDLVFSCKKIILAVIFANW